MSRLPTHRPRRGLAWLLAGVVGLGGASGGCGGGSGPDAAASGDAAGVERGAGEDAGPAGTRDAAPGGVRLLARREVELAAKPVGLLARDLDGDRIADAVVVTRTPGTLQVLRGGPEGLVPHGPPVPLGGEHPLAPLDLGADGFAVALQDTREVLWFTAGGDLAAPRRVTLAATPRALGAGDLDGDGRGELLVADAEGALVTVFADPRRTELRTPPFPADLHGRPCVVGGLADRPHTVFVGSQLEGALLVYRVAGGAPELLRRVALGGIPRDALEVDLDGDGDRELLVVGGDRSAWALGLGAPGGHAAWIGDPAAAPRDLGAPGAVPVDVEPADLDGDGRDELVLIDFYDSGYGVLGAFDAAGRPGLVQKEYAGQDPVDGALGDFDGDGHVDLAVANRNARRVSLVLGSGFAAADRVTFYQSRRVPVPANPTRVRTANLDDDPLPEAVVICAGDRVVVGRRNRFGLIEAEGPVLARDSGARALFAGARRAGLPTSIALLEAGETGARIVALEPREGAFAVAGAVPAGAEARDLVALRGPDGVTLVAVDTAGGALHVLAPGATAAARLALDEPPLAACALDRDGDGADELAVATHERLLLGDASGLAPAGALAVPGHRPEALRAADVDGDGQADLVVLYAGARDTAPGRVAVLLADAAAPGGFRRAALVETGLAPAALAAGDVDGDGRAEVFCAAQNSHNVNVWTPAGDAGALLRRLPDVGAGLGPLDVHLADLDGDGRLDLVTANNFSFDLSVAYNLSRR